jgi:Xaa-Pro aminopeptidase
MLNKNIFQKRIQKLREVLGQKSFYLPRTDRFFSEYLAPHDERLSWLSGFSGSNGGFYLDQDQAVLFTDGRYLLQAKQEIPEDVTIVDVGARSINQWLLSQIHSMPLLLDPWLTTIKQGEVLQSHTRSIEWLEQNPVDMLWPHQPPYPDASVFEHDVRYAGLSREEKWEALCSNLSFEHPYLVTDCENICWLLNMRGSDLPHTPIFQSYALLRKKEEHSNTPHITLYTQKRTFPPLPQSIVIKTFDHLKEDLKALKKITLDPSKTPQAIANLCLYTPITDPIDALKACKNAVEIEGAKIAHKKDAQALHAFRQWMMEQCISKQDFFEMDADEALYRFRSQQEAFYAPSFPSIVGAGENGAIIHYRVSEKTNKKVEENSVFLVDSGGQYPEGTTDITRVYYLGDNPSKEIKKHYTLVLKGLIAVSRAVFPKGTSGSQLDALARQYMWQEGMDYAHGTGHGVGSFLNVHEGPQGISKHRHVPLSVGMILSIEPGLYIEGRYGMRLENLAYIKNHPQHKNFLCFESLTCVPFEEHLIEYALLTEGEKEWLQAYQDMSRGFF